MSDKRALLLANSVYQLLTAVHLRRALLEGWEADLLVSDVTPGLQDTLPRIQETGLFRRVIAAATQDLAGQYPANNGEKLSEGFRNIPAVLRMCLSEELDTYEAVYFANFDLFTRMLACRFYDSPCAFIGFEDGFSSYVVDFLREDRAAINRHPQGRKIRDKVENMLLYEPLLAMRGDNLRNVALPKIRRDDRELTGLLNHIFDYRRPEMDANVIFLEQSFRADGIPANDLDLIRECRQATDPGRFVVKPHPRNPENLPLQMGLTRPYTGNTPWELLLLNEDPADKTVVTVCSNAALTGRIVFGMDMNTVMLYRLFDGKVLWKEDEVLWRYLRRFRLQFAGKRYYVPETIYEMRYILRQLGGLHESDN